MRKNTLLKAGFLSAALMACTIQRANAEPITAALALVVKIGAAFTSASFASAAITAVVSIDLSYGAKGFDL